MPGRSSGGLPDAMPAVPPSSRGRAIYFSQTVSAISAVVLLSSFLAILWFAATLPKLQRFEEPDRALDLMVTRTMEAQDGLAGLPSWQQWITKWTAGSHEGEQAQAVEWYQELVEATGQPESRLRLAVLEAESGRIADARAAATAWRTMASPLPLYADLIEAAYSAAPIENEREIELQAALAESLPNGWFYNVLAARIAQRAGNDLLYRTVEDQRASRGAQAQRWSRGLMLVELSCLVLGSLILVRMGCRRQTTVLRLPVPGVPPPWPGGVGAAVLLRGGALGALLTMVFLSFAPAEHVPLRALAIPVANVPLLALAYAYLLRPAGLTFRDGFGLNIERDHVGRLVGIVLAIVAAGLWGEWVMGRVAEALSLTNHWAEWFDPDLVWAPPSVLAISLLEYVVFAPIFEELAFRGLLFAVLRRRLSFLPAALMSASIFALAHGYGWIGFISVLWSGVLWAWAYEKTGSLIPGMVAHALNNLLVCLAVMALLR
jgi:uncharacterized protein